MCVSAASSHRSGGRDFALSDRVSSLWSIVLAAGQGRRLASLTGGVPKQFWSPDGHRTLLEYTLDRLAPLVPLTRTVTVIDRSQRALAEALLRTSSSESLGLLLDQPCDRGTAAGVALGLSAVSEMDPDATVILTPSDQGVDWAAEFRRGLRRAIETIESGDEEIVLFGVQPASAIGEYGWVAAGRSESGHRAGFRPVTAFVEKPSLAVAERLLARGAVWNTMVMVARASALRRLYQRHLPSIMNLFDRARTLDSHHRAGFLTAAYDKLIPADFSHDLLTPARGLSLYTWPASMGWSDLGTPDRVVAWMADRPRRHLPAPAAASRSGAVHAQVA